MKKLLFLPLLLLLAVACKKDKDDPNPLPSPGGGSGTPVLVTVLDESGSPLSGAQVSIGPASGVSGSDGKIELKGTAVENRFRMRVEKDGFFTGHLNIRKSGNEKHYGEIRLIGRISIGTIGARVPGTLSGTRFKVEFNGDGFHDENGNAVNGNITVYARYISPENLGELARLMPGGDFAAVDRNGIPGVLESYGFTAIEFRDENNTRVYPDTNSVQVAITIPPAVSNRINSGGADTWFYNEATATWIHGGDISLQGNEVFMPVTSFTYTNCDRMNARATLKARFYCDTVTNPAAGKTITLTGGYGYAMVYTTQTNQNGNVLVEVGIPASGGSYTLKIDQYTFIVHFEANQLTDWGEWDFCDLPDLRPQVITVGTQDITRTNATVGGEVVSDGGYPVTERGIYYSTSPGVSSDNTKRTGGAGIGPFTVSLTGLAQNTTYYYKAFATNQHGTAYGQEFSFKTEELIMNRLCPGAETVMDVDGNTYNTVQIGNQCWTKENLKTGKFSDGSAIPNVKDNTAWENLSTPAWCNNQNNADYDATYGKLYNWFTVADPRNVCPTGWHVPTDDEWKALEMHLGMSTAETNQTEWRGASANVGGKMKATTGWDTSNTGATNESGFTGLRGGQRYIQGSFENVGSFFGAWWSSSEFDTYLAWDRFLSFESSNVCKCLHSKSQGFSLRCVRD